MQRGRIIWPDGNMHLLVLDQEIGHHQRRIILSYLYGIWKKCIETIVPSKIHGARTTLAGSLHFKFPGLQTVGCAKIRKGIFCGTKPGQSFISPYPEISFFIFPYPGNHITRKSVGRPVGRKYFFL